MREHQGDGDSVLYPKGVVWIPDEDNPRTGTFGQIVGGLGAYYTTVAYVRGGIEYEVLMENDEFTLMEDFFEYDTD